MAITLRGCVPLEFRQGQDVDGARGRCGRCHLRKMPDGDEEMTGHTDSEILAANKTYRRSFGPYPAVVPRILREMWSPSIGTVLDFGAGTHARYALELRDAGYNVTAYDFGRNVGPDIESDALDREYDLVYAANVLNVQSSKDMLLRTLGEIRGAMKRIAIVNYPQEPRKAGISSHDMAQILRESFSRVEFIAPSGRGAKSQLVALLWVD